MASILHIAVGLVGGRWAAGGPSLRAQLGFVALSMLPDADVIAFALGIPYEASFGHRGASHSLCFALLMGLVVGLVARLARGAWLRLGCLTVLVVASHPILDAMTTGGLGVALLWPWSDARIFFDWRPIPVAPIGPAFFSLKGLQVALAELGPSLPLIIYALWPRRPDPAGT